MGTGFYEYGYDAASNRTLERTGSSTATATTFAYNKSNMLCWQASGSFPSPDCTSPPTGATSYRYDLNGNQTLSSAGFGGSYNPANQTTKVTSGGVTQTYSYAGATQNERLTVNATSYSDSVLGTTAARSSGGTQLFTRDEPGQVTGLRNGTARYNYLVDGLGSVAAVTGSGGGVTNRYRYDPYGATTTLPGDACRGAGLTAIRPSSGSDRLAWAGPRRRGGCQSRETACCAACHRPRRGRRRR